MINKRAEKELKILEKSFLSLVEQGSPSVRSGYPELQQADGTHSGLGWALPAFSDEDRLRFSSVDLSYMTFCCVGCLQEENRFDLLVGDADDLVSFRRTMLSGHPVRSTENKEIYDTVDLVSELWKVEALHGIRFSILGFVQIVHDQAAASTVRLSDSQGDAPIDYTALFFSQLGHYLKQSLYKLRGFTHEEKETLLNTISTKMQEKLASR